MYKFSFFIILILVIYTFADENKATSPYPNGNTEKNGPGVSACSYDGSVNPKTCKDDPMSRHELPNECTSIFVNRFEAQYKGSQLVISDFIYNSNYKILRDFKDENRNTFVYYSRCSQNDWIDALDPKGVEADDEMTALKTDYLPGTNIKGLVLTNIFVNEACFPKGFTCNLITYINVLKKTAADFQIALRLSAASVMKQADCSGKGENLDFQALNEVLNFYTVDFTDFNKCTDAYIKTGIIPMDGPGNNLVKLLQKLNTLKIPKNKIHYEFLISPTVPDTQKYNYETCFVRYTKICENKEDGIDKWCADTTCSLREKGKFAKENGAGFIAVYIDASDRNLACKCYNNKYPTFFYMLDGWYDMNKDKTCPLIDRIFT